jgi:hypothetical protein
MSQTTPPTAAEKTYPAELWTILERGNAGDPAALPALKQAFDEHPELADRFGDLVAHAEQALLRLAAGSCLTVKEAASRKLDELRRELAKDAASPLERLLVDRVCVCWLEVYACDVAAAEQLMRSPGAAPANQAAQRRVSAAQARFVAAVKALAILKKPVKPALSPLELLARPVAEARPGEPLTRRTLAASPMAGVPVSN